MVLRMVVALLAPIDHGMMETSCVSNSTCPSFRFR